MANSASSLLELLAAVSRDLRELLAQTIGLGRREFGASLSAIAWAAGGLVVSVLAAAAGCAALVSAVILGAIALGLPPWAAALIVGLALAAGGAGLARYFVGRLGTVDVTLKETRQSIKETFVWVKTQSNR